MRVIYLSILLVIFSVRVNGAVDVFKADVSAYCQYILDKNTAKSGLLKAPELVVHAQNADNELLSQNNLIAALSKDLSDFKKAKLYRQLINEECTYYRLREEAKLHIAFAIPSLQKKALHYKLKQIKLAKHKMQHLLLQVQAKIASQDETITSYYRLDSILQKLENAEQDIQMSMAMMKVPPLKLRPTKDLLHQLWEAEKKRQVTLNLLEKQYNWALQVQTGAQQALFDKQNDINNAHKSTSIQPYVGVFLRYNLGAIPSNSTLDKSLTHYTDWKKAQVNGVQNQLAQLRSAVSSLKLAHKQKIKQLKQHHQNYLSLIQKMQGVDSIKARHFKQQMEADAIMMDIEMAYETYLDTSLRALV